VKVVKGHALIDRVRAVLRSLLPPAWYSWPQVAARLQLKHTKSLFSPIVMKGFFEGVWVRISILDKVSLVIDCRGKIPDDLKLGSENLLTRTMAPDILTGDPFFDYHARITGSEIAALAVLTSEVRRLVYAVVVKQGAIVDAGRLVLKGKLTPEEVEAAVPRLVHLAKQLVLKESDVAARLASNAEHDPLEGVRVRNLRLLLEHFAADQLAVDTCRRLLQTSHQELRFEAAVFLQEEGIDALVEIALAEKVGEDLRVRAVEHLTRASSAAAAIPVMEQLLEAELREPSLARLRRAAITAMGRFRHSPAATQLACFLDGWDVRTAEAAAKALGAIGNTTVEQRLVRLLSAEDSRLVTAGIEALGRLGSATAVEPLLALATQPGSRSLRREAQTAVARIQQRLGDAEQGQLSVALPPEQEGALSPADEDAMGAVSVPEEEQDDDYSA